MRILKSIYLEIRNKIGRFFRKSNFSRNNNLRTREKLILRIKDIFKQILLDIHLLDGNVFSSKEHCREYFGSDLLNYLYNLDLKRTEELKKDFPCIDLYDEKASVSFQISISNSVSKKIKDTIILFEKKELYKSYKCLKFLFIRENLNGIKVSNISNKVSDYSFQANRDILTFNNIINDLTNGDKNKDNNFLNGLILKLEEHYPPLINDIRRLQQEYIKDLESTIKASKDPNTRKRLVIEPDINEIISYNPLEEGATP